MNKKPNKSVKAAGKAAKKPATKKSTPKNFPFIYLDHGKIKPRTDESDTANDLYIWFDRMVCEAERSQISKLCPKALTGSADVKSFWGDCFLYIENIDLDSISNASFTALADKIESWVMKTNDIVKIIFFAGPYMPDRPDKWGAWSAQNYYICGMPLVKKYIHDFPEKFKNDAADGSHVCRIYESLLRSVYADHVFNPTFTTDQAVITTAIPEIVAGFGIEGCDYHELASMLFGILLKHDRKRLAYVNTLPGHVQFAYYTAQNNMDILSVEKPLDLLSTLIGELPASWKKFIGSWLRSVAFDILRAGKKNSSLAMGMVDLILRHNPGKDDYVHCAEFCEHFHNYEKMLAIGLEGIKKYADRAIIQIIYRAAKECGKTDIVAEFEKRL